LKALAALAGVAAALEMGPREKALYLKQRNRSPAAHTEEEVEATLAGTSPASLRSWLRQVNRLP